MPQHATGCDLSVEQEMACRLRTLEGKTWEEVAEAIGKDPATPKRWRHLDEWKAYEQALRAELHDDVVNAHRAVARVGGEARVAAIRRLVLLLDGCDSASGAAALAGALDRLVTSAEDRSGYHRTERVEHGIDNRSPHADTDDESLNEQIEAAQAGLRVIEGG